MLHMDVFTQRLENEHGMETIVTSPAVSYQYEKDGEMTTIENPAEFPMGQDKSGFFLEPMITGTLVFPEQYVVLSFPLVTVPSLPFLSKRAKKIAI